MPASPYRILQIAEASPEVEAVSPAAASQEAAEAAEAVASGKGKPPGQNDDNPRTYPDLQGRARGFFHGWAAVSGL